MDTRHVLWDEQVVLDDLVGVHTLLTQVRPTAQAPPTLVHSLNGISIEFEAAGGGPYGTLWWRAQGPFPAGALTLVNAHDRIFRFAAAHDAASRESTIATIVCARPDASA